MPTRLPSRGRRTLSGERPATLLNDSLAKQVILDLVRATATAGRPDFVASEDRLAMTCGSYVRPLVNRPAWGRFCRTALAEGCASLANHAQVEAAQEAFGDPRPASDSLHVYRRSGPPRGLLLWPKYLDEDAVLVVG